MALIGHTWDVRDLSIFMSRPLSRQGLVRAKVMAVCRVYTDTQHMTLGLASQAYSSLIETMRLYILYRFRDTASYLSKFANFNLPHLHLEPPFGVTPFKFRKDFWPVDITVLGFRQCSDTAIWLSGRTTSM